MNESSTDVSAGAGIHRPRRATNLLRGRQAGASWKTEVARLRFAASRAGTLPEGGNGFTLMLADTICSLCRLKAGDGQGAGGRGGGEEREREETKGEAGWQRCGRISFGLSGDREGGGGGGAEGGRGGRRETVVMF